MAEHLEGSELLYCTAFHILARPDDLKTHVEGLLSSRLRHGITKKPLLVWEPAPPHCNTANRNASLQACRLIDVFSPNHLELISLFEEESDPSKGFDRTTVEQYAKRVLDASLVDSESGAMIVVRAGEHGCLILSKLDHPRWLAPFYNAPSSKVVDPTGAGNTFLGALMVALQQGRSLGDAAIYGTIAASFALEQIGLPMLSSPDGMETWNGGRFAERLDEYRARSGSFEA